MEELTASIFRMDQKEKAVKKTEALFRGRTGQMTLK
jgi:hypothetical protein